MKLRCGDTVIETNYIEYVQKQSSGTAKIYFISGNTLDVVCGLKTTNPRAAIFEGTANQFLDAIENTDTAKPAPREKRKR